MKLVRLLFCCLVMAGCSSKTSSPYYDSDLDCGALSIVFDMGTGTETTREVAKAYAARTLSEGRKIGKSEDQIQADMAERVDKIKSQITGGSINQGDLTSRLGTCASRAGIQIDSSL